jgi:phosphoribosylformylglycinamidine (FGAM) synthase PurS component
VKAAVKQFLATIDQNTAPLIALVTFKDEVTLKAVTKDLNVLLKAIDSLKAEGGGTCPEAAVEALAFTIEHVKKGGQIWFTTDASPYADADIEGLAKLLLANETVLNATVTGDCSMVDSVNDEEWEAVVK